MAEMRGFSRWWVNRRTASRARRALAKLGTRLEVPSSAQVLELGSGGGGMIALLHERYRPVRLVGTDYDPAQVDAARRFLTARWGSIPPTVELRAADALELPFPDGAFDLVVAMLMLHHVEPDHRTYARRPQALREVRRVLRPGAQFVYSEFSRRDDVRASLEELGFAPVVRDRGWRTDWGIYRRPDRTPGAV